MFVQNIINLNAAVHELSCWQTFLSYLAIVKNPIIRSCDANLWLITLKFNRFRVVVMIDVHAKFHWVQNGGSWVILGTEQKTQTSTIQSAATSRTVNITATDLTSALCRLSLNESLWTDFSCCCWRRPINWRSSDSTTHTGWAKKATPPSNYLKIMPDKPPNTRCLYLLNNFSISY